MVGVANDHQGSLVSLQTANYVIRTVRPHELELVARGYKPNSTSQGVAALFFVVLGIATAALTAHAVFTLGGGVLLTAFVAGTALSTVTTGLINLFGRPRRIRV